jgi:hypothetical protein
MRRYSPLRAAVLLTLVAGSIGLVAVHGRGQDPVPQGSRAAFMRQKLEFAKDLLEGLTVEDYDKIEKSARALKKLSGAAEWEVPTIPNFEEYSPLTVEFRRIADEIVKAAGKKNVDAATLGYVRLTTNCVGCHKYVREVTR